jgi:hypothetical protein
VRTEPRRLALSTYAPLSLQHHVSEDERDRVVVDLPDVLAAEKMATDLSGDLLKEKARGIYADGLTVRVTDDEGGLLWIVAVSGLAGAAAPNPERA